MQSAVFSIEELVRNDRWNAGFFVGSATKALSSKHEIKRIGDVVTERREFIEPTSFPDHIFNYVGLEHIESNTGDLARFTPRPGAEVKSRSKVYREGDLLYGRLRPTLNKCLLVDATLTEGISTSEVIVLIPDHEEVRPLFLKYLLLSEHVLDKVAGLVSGAALPRVGVKDFLDIEIPVPPVDVQVDGEKQIRKLEAKRQQWKSAANEIPVRLTNAIWNVALGKEADDLDSAALPKLEAIKWDHPLPSGDFGVTKRKRGRPPKDKSPQETLDI